MPRFAKGVSGNPKGRPPSHKKIGQLRALIGKYGEPVVKRLIKLAVEEGDTAAAKILVERFIPAIKPVELPAKLPPLPDGLAARATALLDYTVTGLLSPSQGVALISALAALSKVIEVDHLMTRIEVAEREIATIQHRPPATLPAPEPAPPPEPEPSPEPSRTVIELEPGETLADAARELGVEPDELERQIAAGIIEVRNQNP